MSVLRNFLIFVGVLVLFIVGAFRYADHHESVQLRQAFEDRHIPLIIDHLMASTKYAEELRQLGYNIPPDGAILHLGGMEFLEIPGEVPIKISYAGEYAIYLYFFAELEGKQTLVDYTLNRSLEIVDVDYSRVNAEDRYEEVALPDEVNNSILPIIQLEINDLIDRMEEQLYGEEKHDD